MAPSQLAYLTGILLLVSATGQGQNNNNCDFDSDIIFFEDDALEKLKNSFQVNGACSPAVWKNEFSNHLQNQLVGGKLKPLSSKDLNTLNSLNRYNGTPDKQRRPLSPRQPHFHNPQGIHFGPYSHRGPRNLPFRDIHEHQAQKREFHNNFLSDKSVKHHIPQSPDYLMPNHPRGPLSSEEFFKPGNKRFERMPQYEDDFSSDIQRRSQNQRRTDFFSDDSSRRAQNQGNFIPFDDQRGSQNQIRPGVFSGDNNGRNPPNQVNLPPIGDQRRLNNQGRPGNFFGDSNARRSNNPGLFPVSNDQTRQKNQGLPGKTSNGRRPQNQNTFLPSDDQRRPQNQGQPGDLFGPNTQREGLNQGSSNDFFRPDGQRRPQQFDGNQNAFENQRLNPSPRPQTTTQRPQTTTLPGPPTWATPPSPCVRQCPNTPEYNPVCGTDRVTYRNPGRLRCEQRCGKASVVVNHYGNCITTTAMPTSTIPTTTTSGRTTSTTPPTFSRNMG